jgi:hypothetical protein
MVKRIKKLKISIESYKEQIKKHFEKLDKDILEDDEITARYHIKEIDKSLIASLEKKMIHLSKNNQEVEEIKELLNKYKQKIKEYKRKLGVE